MSVAERSENDLEGLVHFPNSRDGSLLIRPVPQMFSRLVGREHELERVSSLLLEEHVRCLTLTGPGGVGKSRLAIAVAQACSNQFADGVAYVPLATIFDADLVIPTIGESVGVHGPGVLPAEERLATALMHLDLLLVLDNVEQVATCAPSVASLLAAIPTLKILATSRIPLHIVGEQEFAVPPLTPPSPGSPLEELETNPAATLFVQRARAVRPSFSINAANAADITEICRRLDGLPLALELAAARSKVLPPASLRARLNQRLEILVGGPVDAPRRHRTMREAVSWSYELLTPPEQALFRRIAVFAGPFSFDAVEIVASLDDQQGDSGRSHLLDWISSLIDASLLFQVTDEAGEPRLQMLETLRAFGLEQLALSGESDIVRSRHAAWCMAVAQEASKAFVGHGPGVWGKRILLEIDNMRAALAWHSSRGDKEHLVRLIVALAPLWTGLGHQREGYPLVTTALGPVPFDDGPGTTPALVLASRLANVLGDFEMATEFAETARQRSELANDLQNLADALCVLGNLARGVGHQTAADAHYEKALNTYSNLGDLYNAGYTLVQRAKLGDLGSPDRAGNPSDLTRAESMCREALALYRELGNSWGAARALNHLSYLAYKQGSWQDGARLAAEALTIFSEHDNLFEGLQCIENLADIAGATGNHLVAARLYGAFEEYQERLGAVIWPFYRAEFERELAIVRDALDPDAFAASMTAGRLLSPSQVVEEALRTAEFLANNTSTVPAKQETDRSSGLTERELEVVRLIARGMSNQAIADSLFISVTTVKGHVRSILAKLHLESRTAVAAWAHKTELS